MYYNKSCDYDDENAKGICVKLTLTFTGAGQGFNLYVTISGLISIELPSDEFTYGIFVVTIPVLSMESNRDPTF